MFITKYVNCKKHFTQKKKTLIVKKIFLKGKSFRLHRALNCRICITKTKY